MNAVRTALLAATVLVLTQAPASAQWIAFTDETSSRLTLEPFADDPGGDPLLDDEEKDVAVADLDRDGDEDVVVVRKEPYSNPGARQDLLLLNEDGVLVDRTAELAPGFLTKLTDARDVFAGDFTGDGWPDLVIANTFGQQPVFYRNLGEDGGGAWLGLADESDRLPEIRTPEDVPVLQFCAVWGGDVDGDGDLDLYFSNYAEFNGTKDQLLVNDGAGFFSNETTARLGRHANVAFGTGAEIRDLDGDGDNDIVKISTLYSEPPFDIGVFILFNDGSGDFDEIPFQALDTFQPYMLAVGDLDGDGLLDHVIEGDFQDRVAVAEAAVPDASVEYVTTVLADSPRTERFGGNTRLADVDGDGDLDAGVGPIDTDIANCPFADDFALLQNPGDAMLFDPWDDADDQNFHLRPHDFGFLDLDGDGCFDLFMGLCTGWAVFVQADCAVPQVAPLVNLNVTRGTRIGGDLDSLAASDDDHVLIDAVASGARFLTDATIGASSPLAAVSRLDLTVETGAGEAGVRTAIFLFDFDAGRWVRLDGFSESLEDTPRVYPDVSNPNAYVDDSTGQIRVRVQTSATVPQVPDGYTFRIDQVLIQVTP